MKVGILGGGISGLSAAYYLGKLLRSNNVAHEIVVLNKQKAVGGWMQTKFSTEDGNSSLFELGPRSVRTAGFEGKHTLKLIQDVGLADDIIAVTPQDVAARNRLIYAKGKMHILPRNFVEILKKNELINGWLWWKWVKGFYKTVPPGMESVYDVSKHRFGDEITNYLFDPFVRGVFAADLKQLSMKAAFPQIWPIIGDRDKKNLIKKPSLSNEKSEFKMMWQEDIIRRMVKEKWLQWNLVDGLQSLPKKLESRCVHDLGVKVVNNAAVTSLEIDAQNQQTVNVNYKDLESGTMESIVGLDHIISALSAHDLGEILRTEPEVKSQQTEVMRTLGEILDIITFVDVAVVNLEYKGKPENVLPQVGFGHLVPSCEDSEVLGVTYDSCSFPKHDAIDPEGRTRLTCMMGGSWFNDLFPDPSEENLQSAAIRSVEKQLGITKDPMAIHVSVARRAIPTYRVGHLDLVEKITEYIKTHELPISLAGASYWGVSVNSCIYNSHVIAEQLVEQKVF